MTETSTPAGVHRREFLKILGATGAATAAIGCSTDRVDKLIPYLNNPDETVPMVSNYYASTCRECSASCGVLMETRDGRTFKLEGNPDHPLNRGALCARGQAAVQGLYNPDRYRGPRIRKGNALVPAKWDDAIKLLTDKLTQAQSAGSASKSVFINRHESGSFPAFLDQWLAAFGMPPHLSHDALADDGAIDANQKSYGVAWPTLAFGAATLIVSFGADFLDTWGVTVPQQLDFADARAKLTHAPRFVYVGPRRSLTGCNADTWIGCRPGTELAIVNALRGQGSLADAAQASGASQAALQSLQQEIQRAKPSLLVASGMNGGGSALVSAVNEWNKSLGNVGVTVLPAKPVASVEGMSSDADVAAAIERMRSGDVPILMVRGVNPVFTSPRSAKVAEALAKVPFKVSFSSYPDETSELCDLVLPDHHPIESWGDAQPVPDVITLQQPGMDPVYDTRQTADVLLQVGQSNPKAAGQFAAPNYMRWLIDHFPGGTAAFTAALQKGVGSGALPRRPAPARAAAPAAAAPAAAGSGDFFLVVYPSASLGDGSGANKPWLQEFPDPVTKIFWQTWVEVNEQTAQRLGIDSGDILRIESPNGALELPAYVYMGIHPETVAIAFGQGHTAYGRYAANVGSNAGDLLPASFDPVSGGFRWASTRVTVKQTGKFTQVVTVEGSSRQYNRGIALAMTVDELEAPPKPEAPDKMPGDASHEYLPGLRSPVAADAQGAIQSSIKTKEMGMYDPKNWSQMAKRRWAMTIDLARCTGCQACVTACYAENNIPIVGAPYQQVHTAFLHGVPGGNVLKGREMNWIRLERYWEGGEDGGEFEARFVPMLCQHCGNAPCEPVCPVYATYHSPDGLNVQVYNRCVGTRYCSNNCPYKVRYFNWFGYGEPHRPQYAWPERMNWQLNPDVTVRGKGVMEKCTFCVQRIREAEHRAKAENREVRPDEFTSSCAQACPSKAITFGDAADNQWTVAQLAQDRRGYHVFQEQLNTFPAVVYLKKVNHPASGSAPAGA
ncbi:MAG TPA: 4Fe-4S dicluster domain-containing protein [Gemmatimonadaceae bacterium]|nr:4Fe-4S dicluster domain-containing protein [Gemmatimonadaceae bacterium]